MWALPLTLTPSLVELTAVELGMTALVTIRALQFESDGVLVDEGAATATLTVSRTDGSNGKAGPAWVRYVSSDQTANRRDYRPKRGILKWAAGDMSPKTITIPILNDRAPESPETFLLTLSNARGATLGGVTETVVTILSDD